VYPLGGFHSKLRHMKVRLDMIVKRMNCEADAAVKQMYNRKYDENRGVHDCRS